MASMSTGGEPPLVKASRRAMVLGVARALLSTTVLVAAYFVLPLDGLSDIRPALLLVLALVGLTVIITLQVRSILRSDEPTVRAGEALATTVPLMLLAFSAAYYLMSVGAPGDFTEPLDRLDALYFTVTVFATVGFGDIAAVSSSARIAVTAQMVINLLMIGLGVRVIVGAAREGRRRRGLEVT